VPYAGPGDSWQGRGDAHNAGHASASEAMAC